MAENSAIEWTDHTFNPWIGCTKVSPGCDHCYAARQDGFRRWTPEGWGGPRKRTKTWGDPPKWNAQAEREGRRYRVFCASLADVFDNEVDPAWRADLFSLILATPNLDWLLLTKRIGNVLPMMGRDLVAGSDAHLPLIDMMPLPNVWIGATVVNQAEADRDVPKLLQVPARVRFLSIEPMLGPIDLRAISLPIGELPGGMQLVNHPCDLDALAGLTVTDLGFEFSTRHRIDWVIAGGESGPGARPMHPDWARSLRDQCAAAGVPFLFKQWGEFTPGELADNPNYPGEGSAWRLDQRGQRWHDPMEGLKPRSGWAPIKFIKVGKKAAGRLLDGVQHDGFPT